MPGSKGSKFGGGASCHRCQGPVYHAEQIECGPFRYHPWCFTCAHCAHRLERGSVSINRPTTEVYCAQCYSKILNHKANCYGLESAFFYTSGAGGGRQEKDETSPGTLLRPPSRSSSHGTKIFNSNSVPTERCKRCHKAVFAAERVIAAGVTWHQDCFLCSECNKRLESTTQTERNGEIFCKTCYGKKYGPSGYGFGVVFNRN